MKKIISVLLLGITIFTFAFINPAFAADTAAGEKIFTANCASCHAGGKNSVNPTKSLSQSDLEEYNIYSESAIIAQVTKGKNSMPSFQQDLSADDIANVAAYVMEKAQAGW